MDEATRLASLVFLLGELNLVLGAGCAILGVLLARHRRRLRARRLEAGAGDAARERYRRFVDRELGEARGRRGASAAVARTRQLRIEYLERESAVLAGGGDSPAAWELRENAMAAILARFRELEATLAGDGADPGGQAASGDSGADQAARLRQLEGYRERFNTLHRHAVEEAAANRELREGLRRDRAVEEGARHLLERYEQRRQPLEGFLAQPDVRPLERRHGQPGQAPRPDHRLRRTRALVEANQRQIDRPRERYRAAMDDRETLVRSLRRSLEDATARNDQLRHLYTRQIGALEENLRQSELCVQIVEKESMRRQRVIRDLLARLESEQGKRRDTDALERTIDRFCEQSVELQGRIRDLEQKLARADARVLVLSARLGDAAQETGA